MGRIMQTKSGYSETRLVLTRRVKSGYSEKRLWEESCKRLSVMILKISLFPIQFVFKLLC